MRKASVLVLVLAAACGDDGNHNVGDGPTSGDGARNDGSTSDAAADLVFVTVSQGGAPRAGVQIYFQNADSTTAGSAVTDSSGSASQILGAGGYVTAVDPFLLDLPAAQSDQLYTIAGVQPGDHLVFSTPVSGGAAPPELDFTLTVPYAPTAYNYSIDTVCGNYNFPHDDSGTTAPPTHTVTLYGCPAIVDALVTANGPDGELLGSFWSMQQPILSGATIDLSAHTYEAPVTSTVTANTDDNVYIQRLVYASQGLIFTAIGDVATAGGHADATLVLPMLDGATRETEVRFDEPYTSAVITTWGPTAGDETIDVDSGALAPFTSAPSLSVSADAIAWTTGTGAVPDFVTAGYYDTRADRTWSWRIAAPSGTSVTFPTLPAAGAEWNPSPTDSITSVAVELLAVPGGWSATRPSVFGDFFFVLGTTGTGAAATASYSGSPD
ncbi:MAG TPA: hypothetical protein VGM88_20770 [Kofleriaceae bacterium]|jgi:hypothetical protein